VFTVLWAALDFNLELFLKKQRSLAIRDLGPVYLSLRGSRFSHTFSDFSPGA